FDVPAAVDEFDRQIVEQLGMLGSFALAAKVVEHLGDADAGKQIPAAIGHHAGGQAAGAVFDIAKPVGQIKPGGTALDFKLAEKLGDCRLDDLAAVVHPIAAGENADRAGLDGDGNHALAGISPNLRDLPFD